MLPWIENRFRRMGIAFAQLIHRSRHNADREYIRRLQEQGKRLCWMAQSTARVPRGFDWPAQMNALENEITATFGKLTCFHFHLLMFSWFSAIRIANYLPSQSWLMVMDARRMLVHQSLYVP